MSNLSDLLPAGAGGKQVDFVASGTLGSGVTVALKADGTVTAIASDAGGAEVGTAVVFEAAYIPTSNDSSIVFDPVNNKVVITYPDSGNSSYGTAIVGTVSGTSITFGTAVVFESAAISNTRLVFDSNSNKVVVAFRLTSNLYGYAKVGTVSGTSISFGSSAVFNSATSYHIEATFDSNSNKVVIVFRNAGNSSYGTGVVATVSGTSISYGSLTVFNSASSGILGCVFDSSNNKVVIPYYDGGNSNYGTAIVGTVSGTSISFGTATVFKAATTFSFGIAFDSSENKIVIAYKTSSPYTLSAVVGTVSGTSISYGSEANIGSYDTNSVSVTYDSSANKIVVFYNADGTSYAGYASVGAISGTSISFDPFVAFSGVQTYSIVSTFDSTANKIVLAYTDANNSGYGTSVVFQTAGSNNTDFIGITDAAISSAASGSVTIKGGISTNVTGLTANSTYYVQADGTLNTATSESAYDIANASYTQAFSVSAQDAIPKGVAFNPTGTKMFIAGGTANNVHEYDLSTGFDVSTASFVDSFSVNAQVIQIEGVTFNPTGTKMFVAGAYGAAIFEYDLSAGFDVSTAVYSQNFSVSAQDTGPTGVVFNSNGSKMFVVGKTNDAVYEYALSTGFDVSTASFTDSFSVSSQETSPHGIAFNAEGTAMFIVGQTGDDVNEYTLATGFDVSTSSFTDSFSVAGQEISPSGLAFNPDGTKMFVVGYDGDDVNQYATTSTVTNSTTVLAGKALSSTSINLDYTT
jgi:hypothetical protein